MLYGIIYFIFLITLTLVIVVLFSFFLLLSSLLFSSLVILFVIFFVIFKQCMTPHTHFVVTEYCHLMKIYLNKSKACAVYSVLFLFFLSLPNSILLSFLFSIFFFCLSFLLKIPNPNFARTIDFLSSKRKKRQREKREKEKRKEKNQAQRLHIDSLI